MGVSTIKSVILHTVSAKLTRLDLQAIYRKRQSYLQPYARRMNNMQSLGLIVFCACVYFLCAEGASTGGSDVSDRPNYKTVDSKSRESFDSLAATPCTEEADFVNASYSSAASFFNSSMQPSEKTRCDNTNIYFQNMGIELDRGSFGAIYSLCIRPGDTTTMVDGHPCDSIVLKEIQIRQKEIETFKKEVSAQKEAHRTLLFPHDPYPSATIKIYESWVCPTKRSDLSDGYIVMEKLPTILGDRKYRYVRSVSPHFNERRSVDVSAMIRLMPPGIIEEAMIGVLILGIDKGM
jgi:hypothetical protein